MGTPNYFLGIEVHHLGSGDFLLTQSKYIRDLLQRSNMTNCHSIATPMVSSVELSKTSSGVISDPHHYRSVVGALQYVTLTHPDIAFSVNKVC